MILNVWCRWRTIEVSHFLKLKKDMKSIKSSVILRKRSEQKLKENTYKISTIQSNISIVLFQKTTQENNVSVKKFASENNWNQKVTYLDDDETHRQSRRICQTPSFLFHVSRPRKVISVTRYQIFDVSFLPWWRVSSSLKVHLFYFILLSGKSVLTFSLTQERNRFQCCFLK